ncbi:DUF6152 family protein [Rheinheimera texasensis]|uniref:DUF6152 family protein n=1 Tax=Rheinheimera texasensis TaxID=306205 RepID=UPI0032B2EFBF
MSEINQDRRVFKLASVLLLVVIGLHSARSDAHHAFSAEFDAQKPFELSGTVTKGKWVNPHSWVYLDVKDKDGKITNWGFEFGSPFALKQKGLTKATLPVGTLVKVKGYLAKDGQNFGYSTSIELPDGRVFQTGGAQDAPTRPATPAAPTTAKTNAEQGGRS